MMNFNQIALELARLRQERARDRGVAASTRRSRAAARPSADRSAAASSRSAQRIAAEPPLELARSR